MNSTVKLSDAQRQHLLTWVEDLESGQHQQTNGVLARKIPGGIAYCCVGRLCEVAVSAGLDLRRLPAATGRTYGYVDSSFAGASTSGHTSTIVPEVEEWIGLDNAATAWYARMNDDGKSFLEIAAQIRRNYDLGPRDA